MLSQVNSPPFTLQALTAVIQNALQIAESSLVPHHQAVSHAQESTSVIIP